jgi:hypothetical protein
MTDIIPETTGFNEEDTKATSFAAVPSKRKPGRPTGSKNINASRVPPPAAGAVAPKRKTAEERAAERKAKLKTRENQIVKSIHETINPLIAQGVGMMPRIGPLCYVWERGESGKPQLVLVDETPVISDFGRAFFINDLEAQIAAMSVARLDSMGKFGSKVADYGDKVLPYALVAALCAAGFMYAQRTTAVLKQVTGKGKPRVEEAVE